jgi:hypothetical protein
MITRVWHGWTTPANAPKDGVLLREEIFVGIARREIRGYLGISLLKRSVGDEVEFVTVVWFSDLHAVGLFAGADCETAVVPPKARGYYLDLTNDRPTMRQSALYRASRARNEPDHALQRGRPRATIPIAMPPGRRR